LSINVIYQIEIESSVSKGDEYMVRRLGKLGILFTCFFLLGGCHLSSSEQKIKNVGLLITETVNDQVWGTKGYKGMLTIQSQYHIDVYYKEGIVSKHQIDHSIQEFEKKGVNLIFGHGNFFAEHFNSLASNYPSIHFVSFNGDAKKDNTTSFSFDGYAMGFFGGMVAGYMTKTNKIGIIAAYDWQPEVQGFYEGVLYQNPEAVVEIKYVEHWDDVETALGLFEELLQQKTDVFYPAGDRYNVPIIERVKENGLYAIGYISDQSYLGEQTVLTSTVQHVDKLYELAASEFNEGTLESGKISVDFQDDVISLGTFSPLVDQQFQADILKYIETYKQTGKLPNED